MRYSNKVGSLDSKRSYFAVEKIAFQSLQSKCHDLRELPVKVKNKQLQSCWQKFLNSFSASSKVSLLKQQQCNMSKTEWRICVMVLKRRCQTVLSQYIPHTTRHYRTIQYMPARDGILHIIVEIVITAPTVCGHTYTRYGDSCCQGIFASLQNKQSLLLCKHPLSSVHWYKSKFAIVTPGDVHLLSP